MGVPLWIADRGWEAANDVDVSRALAAGLRLRPLAGTVEAVEAARRHPGPGVVPTFSSERERELLERVA